MEGHARIGKQRRNHDWGLPHSLISFHHVWRVWWVQRKCKTEMEWEKTLVKLPPSFLQHKCCIITISEAKTDSHKCEKENIMSCPKTSTNTLQSLAATIFFSLIIRAYAHIQKMYSPFTADGWLSSSDSEKECQYCSSDANVCDELRQSFSQCPVLLIFSFQGVCVCVCLELNKFIFPAA